MDRFRKPAWPLWSPGVRISPSPPFLAEYRGEGTGRCIRKLLGANPAEPTLALDYYHNNSGQITEVRKDASANPLEQYVWSPRYVHAPILRWRDGNTDGDLEDEGDSTLYYCADANFNVTALVDTSGAVVERYLYDPYGKARVLNPDWSADENGDSDFANELLFTGHRLDPESGPAGVSTCGHQRKKR